MKFYESGISGNKTIMLLPGNFMTHRQFEFIAPKLAEEYHVICVDFDGYDETGETTYTTAEDQAQKLANYIKANLDGRIDLVYAESLGSVPAAALPLMQSYGTKMGQKIASVIHGITSIPGVSKLMWKHAPRLMRTSSSPEKGYTRRIVSETNGLVGVDILSCPLHDAAVIIGVPEAALMVCAMDKAYMTGFKHIRYTRTKSVAEGAECCDYRLSYDKTKK